MLSVGPTLCRRLTPSGGDGDQVRRHTVEARARGAVGRPAYRLSHPRSLDALIPATELLVRPLVRDRSAVHDGDRRCPSGTVADRVRPSRAPRASGSTRSRTAARRSPARVARAGRVRAGSRRSGLLPPGGNLYGRAIDVAYHVEILECPSTCRVTKGRVHRLAHPRGTQLTPRGLKRVMININRGASHAHHDTAQCYELDRRRGIPHPVRSETHASAAEILVAQA
jgi:hypothetical protein